MKKQKFNCVQMKWDIQKLIAEKYAGLPDEEINQREKKEIAKNPLLRDFLRKVKTVRTGHTVA